MTADGRTDEAETLGRTGVDVVDVGSSHRPMVVATLAEICLATGRGPEALFESTAAVRLLDSRGTLVDGTFVRRVHAEALFANGHHHDARAFVGAAKDELLARADVISDSTLRQSFLERVPDNARIVTLAREWGC